MDRRGILKTVLGYCGGTACSGVLGSLATGCDSKPSALEGQASAGGVKKAAGELSRKPSFEPQLLTVEQALTLEDLSEQIIPETTTPGAKKAGVAEQIEVQLREVLSEADTTVFLKGLDAVSARAKLEHGRPFFDCNATQQASLFAAMLNAAKRVLEAGSEAPFFTRLRELTINAFCESKLGATRVLQYESIPGAYKACVPLESIGRAWATR